MSRIRSSIEPLRRVPSASGSILRATPKRCSSPWIWQKAQRRSSRKASQTSTESRH